MAACRNVHITTDSHRRLEALRCVRDGKAALWVVASEAVLRAFQCVREGGPTAAPSRVAPLSPGAANVAGPPISRRWPKRHAVGLTAEAHAALAELAGAIELRERRAPVSLGEALSRVIAAELEAAVGVRRAAGSATGGDCEPDDAADDDAVESGVPIVPGLDGELSARLFRLIELRDRLSEKLGRRPVGGHHGTLAGGGDH